MQTTKASIRRLGDTLVLSSSHLTIWFTTSAILAVRQKLVIIGTAQRRTILMPRTTLGLLDIANLPPEDDYEIGFARQKLFSSFGRIIILNVIYLQHTECRLLINDILFLSKNIILFLTRYKYPNILYQ